MANKQVQYAELHLKGLALCVGVMNTNGFKFDVEEQVDLGISIIEKIIACVMIQKPSQLISILVKVFHNI